MFVCVADVGGAGVGLDEGLQMHMTGTTTAGDSCHCLCDIQQSKQDWQRGETQMEHRPQNTQTFWTKSEKENIGNRQYSDMHE